MKLEEQTKNEMRAALENVMRQIDASEDEIFEVRIKILTTKVVDIMARPDEPETFLAQRVEAKMIQRTRINTYV